MDDWAKAVSGGEWSRRRFLLQTATFSALPLFGSPRRRNCTREHGAYILCGERVPCFEVVSNERTSRPFAKSRVVR
jgi:hypothetical protein